MIRKEFECRKELVIKHCQKSNPEIYSFCQTFVSLLCMSDANIGDELTEYVLIIKYRCGKLAHLDWPVGVSLQQICSNSD